MLSYLTWSSVHAYFILDNLRLRNRRNCRKIFDTLGYAIHWILIRTRLATNKLQMKRVPAKRYFMAYKSREDPGQPARPGSTLLILWPGSTLLINIFVETQIHIATIWGPWTGCESMQTNWKLQLIFVLRVVLMVPGAAKSLTKLSFWGNWILWFLSGQARCNVLAGS